MTVYRFKHDTKTTDIKALGYTHACQLFQEQFGFWPDESFVDITPTKEN